MNKFVLTLMLWCCVPGISHVEGADWDEVEAILQRQGEKAGNSVTFSYPRIDRGPGTGKRHEACPSSLVSKIHFRMIGKKLAALEGEIVALPFERPAVETKLVAEGLTVTKVNQIFKRKGAIARIHFSGQGDPATLVWAFTPALSATDTPMGPPLFPAGNRCSQSSR